MTMRQSIADCHVMSSIDNDAELGQPVAAWQDIAMDAGFGSRLAFAMAHRRLNQKELAEKAGMSAPAVSRHLERTKPPTRDSVEKYCEALDVSYEWLTHGRAQMEREQATEVAAAPMAPRVGTPHGLAVLELVLSDYVWPSGVTITVIDTIIAEARESAETDAGRVRPMSAWRAFLNEMLQLHARRTNPLRKVRHV